MGHREKDTARYLLKILSNMEEHNEKTGIEHVSSVLKIACGMDCIHRLTFRINNIKNK
jgi:hypothetical protein